jgi:hypothetical protein
MIAALLAFGTMLLILIDTDESGKISKKEFIEVEIDRLDTTKSGELDSKELRRSQARASSPSGGK